jgi:hypothetical protein
VTGFGLVATRLFSEFLRSPRGQQMRLAILALSPSKTNKYLIIFTLFFAGQFARAIPRSKECSESEARSREATQGLEKAVRTRGGEGQQRQYRVA